MKTERDREMDVQQVHRWTVTDEKRERKKLMLSKLIKRERERGKSK